MVKKNKELSASFEINPDVSEELLCKDAIKVVLTPSEPNLDLDISNNFFDFLIGEKISQSCIISVKEIEEIPSMFEDILEGLEENWGQVDFLVKKVSPMGVVEVTDKTKVVFEDKIAEEKDLPKNKVISVKNCPNIKKLIELENLNQVLKFLKEDMFVNRFENDSEIIYFFDKHYFRIEK